MSTQSNKIDIKLEAVKAVWGREHCRKWGVPAAPANNDYIDLNWTDALYQEVQGYLWFNEDALGADPAIAGKVAIVVPTVAGGSVADTLAAIKLVIDADANFKDTIVDATSITIENAKMGPITAELDSGATGFNIDVPIEGIGGDLGSTAQGGSTLSMDPQTFELKSDQTAENLLGEVMMGNSISLEMNLIELTKERWDTILGGVIGDVHTPSGGTSLVGLGESKTYKNLFDFAGKLILHPIRLDAADLSEDIIIHKSSPVPTEVNFSGTEQQGMAVTFKAYLDKSVNSKINMMARGDHSQDLS